VTFVAAISNDPEIHSSEAEVEALLHLEEPLVHFSYEEVCCTFTEDQIDEAIWSPAEDSS
jgi:hypothetical protein